MSARLSLLALPALLLLGACDGNPLQAVPSQKTVCNCPADAAPAATPAKPTKAGGVTRAVATGGEARTYRTRGGGRGGYASTGGGYVSYESSGGGYSSSGYGGRYGARGGVSVSVTETESSSSRYSATESSSSYGYSSGGGVGYAGGGAYGYGPGGAVASSTPPHYPGYRAAQTDRDGYLTWPGKVED